MVLLQFRSYSCDITGKGESTNCPAHTVWKVYPPLPGHAPRWCLEFWASTGMRHRWLRPHSVLDHSTCGSSASLMTTFQMTLCSSGLTLEHVSSSVRNDLVSLSHLHGCALLSPILRARPALDLVLLGGGSHSPNFGRIRVALPVTNEVGGLVDQIYHLWSLSDMQMVRAWPDGDCL